VKPRFFYLALTLALILSAGFSFLPARAALAASVSVSPDRGKVDTIVHISGTGFTSAATFTTEFAVYTAFRRVESGTVAPDGTISDFITVPEMPGGSYTVRVSTPSESASDTFTVEPDVDLDQTSAVVGDQINISGTGFRANRTVYIEFDGTTVATTDTNSRGSFSKTFTVPEGDRGSHDVTADDGIFDDATNLNIEQSISITPDSGTTGSSVTINGYGFRSDRNIVITFDGEPVDTSPSSVRSDSNGGFTASFDVPTCINQTPEVEASDGRYKASTQFTIIASISLTPNSGEVGDTITVVGNGFRPNQLIKLTLNGEPVVSQPMTIRSDSTGCFDAEFDIPPSTSGGHQLKAADSSEAAQATLTTLPKVSLSPSSGPINAEVTISGSGFGADRVVTIRFDNEHVGTSATDAEGSFTDQFVVPPTHSGNYNVTASDGVTTTSAVFTVTTSVEISPQTGHVGSVITVNGTGFTGSIVIKYDDTVVANTIADANGTFSISFNAPKSKYGLHTITISGTVNTIETTFTMESAPPPVPQLISPENGSRQGSRPSFSWSAVSDPSGVTYTLQIATDNSFNTLLLDKQGLTQPQYTLIREEGLHTTDSQAPYYWRVRAIDGASNESDWATPRSFYVRYLPQWALYVIIAAVSVVIAVLATRSIYRRRK
jgi:hypothetical protein